MRSFRRWLSDPIPGWTIGRLYALIGTLWVGVVIFAVACTPRTHQPNEAMPNPAPVTVVEYRDFGNGVYYFEETGDRYMQMLALFYKDKPRLHCDLQGFTERTRDPRMAWSQTNVTGFILHCHDIAVSAQDVTVP